MKNGVIAGVVMLVAGMMTASAQPSETTIELKNGQGESIGTATLSAARSGGVSVELNLKNLAPGRHAIHFHESPKCEGPAFESAGPHYNPDSKKHGLLNAEGPHAGDVNNFTAKKDGTAKTTLVAARMSMDTPSALVVHAQADDLKSDPAGNSGERIGCGVVRAGVATR